jgi:hypothetical protein
MNGRTPASLSSILDAFLPRFPTQQTPTSLQFETTPEVREDAYACAQFVKRA